MLLLEVNYLVTMATTTWSSCSDYTIISIFSYHLCKGYIDQNAPLLALSLKLITYTALLTAIKLVSQNTMAVSKPTLLQASYILVESEHPLREVMSNCSSDHF